MKPSTRKVLRRLEQGPATTSELGLACGFRFGARICELRELGYTIVEERLPAPASGSRYTLTGRPQVSEPVEEPASCFGARNGGRSPAEDSARAETLCDGLGTPSPSSGHVVEPSYAARNDERSPATPISQASAEPLCDEPGGLFDGQQFYRARGAYDTEEAA